MAQQKQTEDLNNLAKEVDRQMLEIEERVVTNLSRYIEEQTDHVSSHVEQAIEGLNDRIIQLQSQITPKNNRSKVIEANQIMDNG